MTQQPYQFTEFPERSRDELAALYDTQAPTYRAQITFVDRYLGVAGMRGRLFAKARGDVLDVACGTGENFRFLPQNIRSLTAVDLSPGMVKLAGDEARKLGIDAQISVMDAGALNFEDARFDTVISSLATCTFPDPIKALDEMARVCKPDGRILLVEHGRSRVKWIARLQDRFAHGQFNAHACRWNQESLALVKASGSLRVVEAKTRLFGILHAIEAAPSR